MICFGLSFGPFYSKKTYLFFVGSIIGNLIGALCAYNDIWFNIFKMILYLLVICSVLRTIVHYWFSKYSNQSDLENTFIETDELKEDEYSNYCPHINGVIVIFFSFLMSSAFLPLYLFVIPKLISDFRSVLYIYLLYGTFNVRFM